MKQICAQICASSKLELAQHRVPTPKVNNGIYVNKRKTKVKTQVYSYKNGLLNTVSFLTTQIPFFLSQIFNFFFGKLKLILFLASKTSLTEKQGPLTKITNPRNCVKKSYIFCSGLLIKFGLFVHSYSEKRFVFFFLIFFG